MVRPLVVVMTEGARSFARRKLRGAHGALEAAQAMLAHTLATAALVGDVRVCAPAGSDAVDLAAELGLPWIPQATGSLGARVSSSLRSLLAENARAVPSRPVLLIGDDCPGLTIDLLADAADALENGARSVVGRASDGGFWLLGLSSLDLSAIEALEARVAWSTSRAAETLESFLAETFGKSPALIAEQRDLDEPGDLRFAVEDAGVAGAAALRNRLAAVNTRDDSEPAGELRGFIPVGELLAGGVSLPRPPPRS